jgi:hypothetical protein
MRQKLVEVVKKMSVSTSCVSGEDGGRDSDVYLCETPRVVSIKTRVLISTGRDDIE